MFPGAEDNALELLRGMLIFSPDRRVSVDEAIAHPFFDDVREDELIHPAAATMSPAAPLRDRSAQEAKLERPELKSAVQAEVVEFHKHLLREAEEEERAWAMMHRSSSAP